MCADRSDSPPGLTILDWLGVIVTGLMATGLLLWPMVWAPVFRSMFSDMGGTNQLPRLTLVVLSPWFGPLWGALDCSLVIVGIARRATTPLGHRRALVVIGFCGTLVGWAICLVGAYQPIFELAGSIRGP